VEQDRASALLLHRPGKSWRGNPLTSCRVVFSLITATTTSAGLVVRAKLDTSDCPAALMVAASQMVARKIRPAQFRGQWNYTLFPRRP
jgi:hypothetical protein